MTVEQFRGKPFTAHHSSGLPRALLLTWGAWWLVVAAIPLNLLSPDSNKGSVSDRVSSPQQPWTLGGDPSLVPCSRASTRTVDLTAVTEKQRARCEQGEEKGRASMRSGRGAEIGQVFLSLRPLPPAPSLSRTRVISPVPSSQPFCLLFYPHALPYFTFNLLPTSF